MCIIEFRLQPIFDLFGIVAFEALLDHPDCVGLFAIADPEFEALCFNEAVKHTRNIPYPIFVNISAQALVQMRNRLILAKNTVVEITEHRPADFNLLKDAVQGLQISIDDLGSGNSCRFLELNPQWVKISVDIIKDCHVQDVKLSLLKEFASWSKFGIRVIAEGIETEEEYRACVEKGIRLFQGYWLARPAKSWNFINLRKEGV